MNRSADQQLGPSEPSSEGVDIAPTTYVPSSTQVRSNRGRQLIYGALAVAGVIATVVLWFLFTARSVVFETVPESALLSVSGPLQFEFQGVHLLRQGSYRVQASATGYEPFDQAVAIGREANQTITLALAPLPGRVTLTTEPAGVNIYRDGELLGTTPVTDLLLPAGDVTLGLQKPRYQDATVAIAVTGRDQQQSERFELRPDWAEVTLSSDPPGAEILIDDQPTGVETPGTVEVLAGEHELSLSLPGHERFRRRIVAAAQVPMTLDPVALNRADAELTVSANRSNVGLVLNGSFQGQTPLTLALKSGERYELRAFKAGYGDVVRTVALGAGETKDLALSLTPLIGTLVVRTQPANAELYVGGKRRSQEDGSISLSLPTRPQKIEVRLPGYAGYSTTITPKAGLTQELRIKLLTEAEARLAALKPTITAASGQELVLIQPKDPFQLGASRREPGRRANEPIRQVTLSRLYYLARHEVTNEAYKAFSAAHDSGSYEDQALDKDAQPVVSIGWMDAVRYCNWLSEQDDLPPFYKIRQGELLGINPNSTGYRLPTEAEWGYAARQVPDTVETPLRFPWGPRLPPPDRHGNYADRSAANTVGRIIFGYNDNYIASAPVGTYAPNALGVFDLGGNVAEWIHDFYEIPKAPEQRDPLGPSEGEFHMIKGASWMHGTITDLRLSYRDYGIDGREDLGFRVARFAEAP